MFFNNKIRLSILSLYMLGLFACVNDSKPTQPTKPTQTPKTNTTVKVPDFNADKAYEYIQKQVDFGPRVPGTETHKACADWLEATLKEKADEVVVQKATVTVFDGTKVPMYNVIASFNPENPKRIMLSAHWDTRPFADQDTERKEEPIEGANDGGSGVGVLLAIADVLKENDLDLGVDIFLWDVEDYGKGKAETYCLGSQYWSRNPHEAGYEARYGILLDMVGGKNAVFYQEGHSLQYAGSVVNKFWKAAHKAGYSGYFPYQRVNPITDDHFFINVMAGIPTIDIIQYDNYAEKGFFEHWHTHGDNMDAIDKNTLKAVGQSVLQLLYEEGQ